MPRRSSRIAATTKVTAKKAAPAKRTAKKATAPKASSVEGIYFVTVEYKALVEQAIKSGESTRAGVARFVRGKGKEYNKPMTVALFKSLGIVRQPKAKTGRSGNSFPQGSSKARADLLQTLKDEAATLRAWKADGSKASKRPSTPATDKRNAEIAAREAKAKADAQKARAAKSAA
jgi:hypothetical protein